jgi:hypothetical protein
MKMVKECWVERPLLLLKPLSLPKGEDCFILNCKHRSGWRFFKADVSITLEDGTLIEP